MIKISKNSFQNTSHDYKTSKILILIAYTFQCTWLAMSPNFFSIQDGSKITKKIDWSTKVKTGDIIVT